MELHSRLAELSEAELRAKAWIGDAVLALFAREWLCARDRALDADAFARMTSNQFLANFGQPTKVEAHIGLTYETVGLQTTFQWLETHLLPRFEREEANRHPQARQR